MSTHQSSVLKKNTTITLTENGLLLLQDSISSAFHLMEKVMAKAAHSAKQDIEMAVDTASGSFQNMEQKHLLQNAALFLNKIADRIEENLPISLQ